MGEKGGGSPPVGPISDDRTLWQRFFKAGAKLEIIPQILLDYRRHLGNQTFWLEDKAHVYDEKAMSSVRKHLEWKVSLFLRQGMRQEAREELNKLFTLDQKKSLKNKFYYGLTYLPSAVVHGFMWEVRPWIRWALRRFKKIR